VHRLVTGSREIDDRQPVVGEAYAALLVDPDVGMIGPAMRDSVFHPRKRRPCLRTAGPATTDKSSESAHVRSIGSNQPFCQRTKAKDRWSAENRDWKSSFLALPLTFLYLTEPWQKTLIR
jgi:hypothetical protein